MHLSNMAGSRLDIMEGLLLPDIQPLSGGWHIQAAGRDTSTWPSCIMLLSRWGVNLDSCTLSYALSTHHLMNMVRRDWAAIHFTSKILPAEYKTRHKYLQSHALPHIIPKVHSIRYMMLDSFGLTKLETAGFL